jgi:hypothetical protein
VSQSLPSMYASQSLALYEVLSTGNQGSVELDHKHRIGRKRSESTASLTGSRLPAFPNLFDSHIEHVARLQSKSLKELSYDSPLHLLLTGLHVTNPSASTTFLRACEGIFID